MHIDNKEKYKPVLGKGPTQGLGDTTVTAEAESSEDHKKNFVCMFILMEATAFYL